ncbi:MAG: hypothetical protein JWQ11_147 [Rhizobacter sp.]|nr:hypothetical protein [Rhizobacter sp.]
MKTTGASQPSLQTRVHNDNIDDTRMNTARPAYSALIAFAAALACGSGAFAQSSDSSVSSTPSELRVGYEHLKLPGDEGLGMIGTTYLLHLTPNLMVGPAAYGAIEGQRGGLFTVGVEGAWRQPLFGPLALDAGLYVGGGGGGVAPVGGGLMLRPHLDLTAGFGRYRAGVSWSKVKFPNGQIDSNQVGLVLSVDTDFSHASPGSSSASLSGVANMASGLGIDRVVGVAGAYRPRSGTLRLSGTPMNDTVGYVGARLEHEFAPGLFGGVETNGAASGGAGGYAEYLATASYEVSPFPAPIKLGGRLGLGMGGGGDVSVGGGLLAKGSIYGSVQLTSSLALGLEGGYARAPNGDFKAPFAAANLVWTLDDRGSIGTNGGAAPLFGSTAFAGSGSNANGSTPSSAVTRTEWVAGVERYDAQRRDGSTRAIDNVVLKANRFVTDTVYVTGQVHSAFAGNAGGYTVGLVGVGAQSPDWSGWRLGGEMLAGAAGGGGLDTQGGAIVQPTVYLDRALTPALSARLSVGRIDSLKGRLGATVGEVALVYSYGVSGAK